MDKMFVNNSIVLLNFSNFGLLPTNLNLEFISFYFVFHFTSLHFTFCKFGFH